MEHYDFVYIDEKIIGGVEKNLHTIQDIIRSVEKRATGKVQSTFSVATSDAPETAFDGEAR
jgi:hypothetical protein